jgi:hypothetical protein
MKFGCRSVAVDSLIDWRVSAESVEASTSNIVPVCNTNAVVDHLGGVLPSRSSSVCTHRQQLSSRHVLATGRQPPGGTVSPVEQPALPGRGLPAN